MTEIIIGAGASGLACAIRLKQNMPNDEVILLERLDTLGKKILATGNGRCNLSNEHAKHYKEVINFFNNIGLKTKIITDCTVKSVDRDLIVSTDCGMFYADSVIIAAGGMAQSSLGSNGSGYEILKNLGHRITPLSPALVQLVSSSKYPRQLKGQRVKGNMKILLDGECVKQEYGEILFTDYGLSGIVSMNLSEAVSKNFECKTPKKCHAVIDLANDFSEDELLEHINKFGSLEGILGEKVSSLLEKQANGDKKKICKYAKNWQLIITGTKGYNFAQITSGGADLTEFNNFESKLIENLYACGEILDRQFECGGYNLNFAFYSGISVADEIKKKRANNDKN